MCELWSVQLHRTSRRKGVEKPKSERAKKIYVLVKWRRKSSFSKNAIFSANKFYVEMQKTNICCKLPLLHLHPESVLSLFFRWYHLSWKRDMKIMLHAASKLMPDYTSECFHVKNCKLLYHTSSHISFISSLFLAHSFILLQKDDIIQCVFDWWCRFDRFSLFRYNLLSLYIFSCCNWCSFCSCCFLAKKKKII